VVGLLLLSAGLRIVSPQPDEFVRGPRVIRVDPGGLEVERVEFYVDDLLVGRDDQPPFARLHDFGAGTAHQIRVVAQLRRGAPLEAILAPPPAPRVSARARAVVLDVAVYDRGGELVTGLGPADFAVLEDGVAQELVDFGLGADDPRPLAVLLAVDVSDSMRERLEAVGRAARAFVGGLRPADRAALLTFNRDVRVLVDFDQPRTGVLAALERLEAAGDTAFYRALEESSLLLRETAGRRVLVVFSDGMDSSSFGLNYEQVRRELVDAEVTVFPIGMSLLPRIAQEFLGRRLLQRLARDTGGRAQLLASVGQIPQALARVYQDLMARYRIAYRPPEDCSAAWHSISVRLGAREYQAITRAGYFDRSRR
jgi:VWFA-related protein